MKTQEEIEKLAESRYGTEIGSIRGSNTYDLEGDRKNGFIKGYTQCQEDMADKKYTEGDLKKAFKFYAYAHISQQPHSYEKLEQDYLQFINSLNKNQ